MPNSSDDALMENVFGILRGHGVPHGVTRIRLKSRF